MTKLDSQLDWIVRQIKDFVLSHYSGRISLNCKQGVILQLEKEPTVVLDRSKSLQDELKNFTSTAQPGDTLTFVWRQDDKVKAGAKTTLQVP